MDYIQLEHMRISRIVLGCDRYGEQIDYDTAHRIIDTYRELGGNMLDTARMYTDGKSEMTVGRYLKETASRKDFYISTKCAHPADGISRLNRDDILYDVDKSIKTMDIDYIDLLWLHRDDESVNVESIVDILDELVCDGAVKAVGVSNWRGERIERANNYARLNGKTQICASQILYNMAKCRYYWDDTLVYMEQPGEREFYKKTKMPVFAFSSQAKGFFEKYAENSLSDKSRDRYYNDTTIKTYNAICENAEAHGNTLSFEALDMLVKQSDFEVLPIIGASNVNQLKCTFNIQ